MNTGRQGTKSALVAGASGLVGGALAELLSGSGDYDPVHLLNRRRLGLSASPIREHVVDFEHLDSGVSDIDAVDDAFCCLGTTIGKAGSRAAFRRVDHDYVVAFGKLAAKLGARTLVVVSSLGADPRSRNFYLKVKGETERDLGRLQLPSLVILRPSLLTGDREEFRPGERVGGAVLSVVSPLMKGPLGRFRPVSAVRVARAMVMSAREPPTALTVLESEEIRSATT